jgi:stage V sporulation protein AE
MELVELIKKAACDPVLVMFDDCGDVLEGAGERALRVVANHPDVEVLGVIAVASNCDRGWGAPVDVALDRYGQPVDHAVDKYGRVHSEMPLHIFGDTVGVLRELDVPVVVGIGDLGKMGNNDLPERGAPVTRKAVELILAYYERARGGERDDESH